jgi:hypothetical protein
MGFEDNPRRETRMLELESTFRRLLIVKRIG